MHLRAYVLLVIACTSLLDVIPVQADSSVPFHANLADFLDASFPDYVGLNSSLVVPQSASIGSENSASTNRSEASSPIQTTTPPSVTFHTNPTSHIDVSPCVNATPASVRTLQARTTTGASWASGPGNNPCTFTMPNNPVAVQASFVPTQSYVITVNTSPPGLDSPYGAGTYSAGTSITIGVNAVSGYMFQQWNRDGSYWANQNSFQYTVDGSHTFTAIFKQLFTISVNTNPSGLISPQGAGTYTADTQVTIGVSNVDEYTFQKWQRDGADYSTQQSFQYMVDASHTFTAIFVRNDFAVTVSNTGITVVQGFSSSNLITVTLISGSVQSVDLSCPSLPSGASCRFNPASGKPSFSSTLIIGTLGSTRPSSYPITITGASGRIKRTAQFTLTVTPRTLDNRIANVTYWLLAQGVTYNQAKTTYAAATTSTDRLRAYTDDNARLAMALTFALEYFREKNEENTWCGSQSCPKLSDKIKVAIEFVRSSKSSTTQFYHYWDLTQSQNGWRESGDFSYWDAAVLEGLAVVAVKMRWGGLGPQEDYAYYDGVKGLVEEVLEAWQPRSQQQQLGGSWLLKSQDGSEDTQVAENGMILAALTMMSYYERSLNTAQSQGAYLRYSGWAQSTANWIMARQERRPDRNWSGGGGYGGFYNNVDPVVQYPAANARAVFGLAMYGLNIELITPYPNPTKAVIADVMKAWLDGFVARTHDSTWGPIYSTTSTPPVVEYPKQTFAAAALGTAVLGGFNLQSDSKYKDYAMNFYSWTTGGYEQTDFQNAYDRTNSQQGGFYVGIPSKDAQINTDSNVETNLEMLQLMVALQDPLLPWRIGSSQTTTTNTGQCIIATAAYESELAPPVQFLRDFRDQSVKGTFLGSAFLSAFNPWYYSWAPSVAKAETESSQLRTAVRLVIVPLIGSLVLSAEIFKSLSPINPEIAILVAGLVTSSLLGLTYLTPIIFLAVRATKRRIRGRTFVYVAILGAALTMLGTLSNGTAAIIENLTALAVVQTTLMTPFIVTNMLEHSFKSGKFSRRS